MVFCKAISLMNHQHLLIPPGRMSGNFVTASSAENELRLILRLCYPFHQLPFLDFSPEKESQVTVRRISRDYILIFTTMAAPCNASPGHPYEPLPLTKPSSENGILISENFSNHYASNRQVHKNEYAHPISNQICILIFMFLSFINHQQNDSLRKRPALSICCSLTIL